jgi:NAD(P)-dependent dehydrogenase (short-subunit alcohol dehydrogenase family)
MPNYHLSGKTAIVTGGGRGLGRAMALGLRRAGANVVITAAHNRREIDAVANEVAKSSPAGVVHAIVGDVASEEDGVRVLNTAISEFGAVHILVNNAGRGMRFVSERFLDTPTSFWQTDPAVWRMIIDTLGSYHQHLDEPRDDAAGRFSPYGPSKAALESETIIWAQDLTGTGVTVNSLLPGGATATGMVPESIGTRHGAACSIPLSYIVPPLLWLVSEEAGEVTGARFVANLWDASLPPAQAAEKARAPAG